MAYPQAPIEMDMYMELPQGINIQEPRPQAFSQSVWSETSWTSLEWLFGQQTARDQL
jgi:hypothetical protein